MTPFDAVYHQPKPAQVRESVHRWTTESLENALGWIEATNLAATVPAYAEIHETISGELGQRQHDEQESAYVAGLKGAN